MKMDLRNMCKARKWVWRNGRCGPKALRVGSSDADADKFEKMAGTVSQHGWHGPSRPKPLAPDKPVEGFPRKQTVAPGFFLFKATRACPSAHVVRCEVPIHGQYY